MKEIASNRKAFSEYEILEKIEAGIVLSGWEVKSARSGQATLKDGFIIVSKDEAFVNGINIPRWKTQSMLEKIDTTRQRKLLLKKYEISRIESKIKEKGLTAVPLKMYISNNQKIKIEIGLVRGKKKYEKRQKLKEKDMKRQIERDLADMR